MYLDMFTGICIIFIWQAQKKGLSEKGPQASHKNICLPVSSHRNSTLQLCYMDCVQ